MSNMIDKWPDHVIVEKDGAWGLMYHNQHDEKGRVVYLMNHDDMPVYYWTYILRNDEYVESSKRGLRRVIRNLDHNVSIEG